jgi:hypothetical protein
MGERHRESRRQKVRVKMQARKWVLLVDEDDARRKTI